MNRVSRCEVCNAELNETAINLGLHPLCDDLIPIGCEDNVNTYPIEVMFCDNCLTAHQKYQVPKTTLFPQTYHYRSRFTQDVLNGMKNLVEHVQTISNGIKGKRILDIGCNDGSLLSIFKKYGAQHTIGIEPTSAFDDIVEAHVAYNNYFTPKLAHRIVAENGYPDVITFTNVFAHIENLDELLESVRIVSSENTILVIENHYLGEVIKQRQFDTFYHEHPRTYSLSSFLHIAESLGMSLLSHSFPNRYGGNIRVVLGQGETSDYQSIDEVVEYEKSFRQSIRGMQQDISRWKKNKLKEINLLIEEHGPLRAKAFPGRAAILIKLLGLNDNQVKEVYEKPGSKKIGNYLPGTKIPIVSDEQFNINDQSPVLNLAWHISAEIEAYMRSKKFDGTLVNILTPDDFV